MNKRLLIFGGSLVANVVLAAFLLRPPAPTTNEVPSSANPPGHPAKKNRQRPDESPEQIETNTIPQFNWALLETPDYKEYIERLRAFGVPEKTIREIVIADIQRLYRPRFAALRPPKKPENPKFWENRGWFGSNQQMSQEQREQMRVLTKEQKELIQSLLGKDVYLEIAKDSGYPDWTEKMFGTIPPEHRDKIQEIQERFGMARNEIYEKAEGYVDQETQRELKALNRKLRDEMAAFLSPEQVEEYELRNSDVAQSMRWELRSLEPNEAEFRAIFKLKQASEDLESTGYDLEGNERKLSKEERKALEQQRKELNDAMAQSLGPERVKEYELMKDWTYRNLFEAGLPKESVMKVPDMKKDAEDAARKIRADKSLSPEQRTAALKNVQKETETSLAELLGARQAKAYGRNGGWWLRNLAPQESSQNVILQ